MEKLNVIDQPDKFLRRLRHELHALLGETIRHSVPVLKDSPDGINFVEVVADYERSLIEAALYKADGIQVRAARLLRLRPSTLNVKIKKLNIEPFVRSADAKPLFAHSQEMIERDDCPADHSEVTSEQKKER